MLGHLALAASGFGRSLRSWVHRAPNWVPDCGDQPVYSRSCPTGAWSIFATGQLSSAGFGPRLCHVSFLRHALYRCVRTHRLSLPRSPHISLPSRRGGWCANENASILLHIEKHVENPAKRSAQQHNNVTKSSAEAGRVSLTKSSTHTTPLKALCFLHKPLFRYWPLFLVDAGEEGVPGAGWNVMVHEHGPGRGRGATR